MEGAKFRVVRDVPRLGHTCTGPWVSRKDVIRMALEFAKINELAEFGGTVRIEVKGQTSAK